MLHSATIDLKTVKVNMSLEYKVQKFLSKFDDYS